MKKSYCAPETTLVEVSIPRLLTESQPRDPESKQNPFGMEEDDSDFQWDWDHQQDLWADDE